jgi:hypothetical protein
MYGRLIASIGQLFHKIIFGCILKFVSLIFALQV